MTLVQGDRKLSAIHRHHFQGIHGQLDLPLKWLARLCICAPSHHCHDRAEETANPVNRPAQEAIAYNAHAVRIAWLQGQEGGECVQ